MIKVPQPTISKIRRLAEKLDRIERHFDGFDITYKNKIINQLKSSEKEIEEELTRLKQ